jgi:hypothetical protein
MEKYIRPKNHVLLGAAVIGKEETIWPKIKIPENCNIRHLESS